MTSPPVAPRRAQREERPSKGDRRERALLEAAERLLIRGEFAGASITELARVAGISRATFYFYFASKQALLASVIDGAVSTFNSRILSALDADHAAAPAEAVRDTVRAAGDLWWEHGSVLSASFELGASIPEVYERTMANFAIVREPTVTLLQLYGTVPEAADHAEAENLVMLLMMMSERCYFDLMRGQPTEADRDALTERLARVWLRAFGLD